VAASGDTALSYPSAWVGCRQRWRDRQTHWFQAAEEVAFKPDPVGCCDAMQQAGGSESKGGQYRQTEGVLSVGMGGGCGGEMSGLSMQELEGAVANDKCREGGKGRGQIGQAPGGCLSMVAYCGEYITVRTYVCM